LISHFGSSSKNKSPAFVIIFWMIWFIFHYFCKTRNQVALEPTSAAVLRQQAA
jgi:hypothetical protein